MSSTLEILNVKREHGDPDESAPPQKKRKVQPAVPRGEGLLGPGWEKYDATALVPHYTQAKRVPQKLKKYFAQRERYFSLYHEGCLLDEEGWYSVTPERIANQIAERSRCDTVLDAFCGVGGNAIAFAQTCERVIAIDNNPVRLALARHNAIIYGVQDRIEFILADFPSFARSYLDLPRQKSQDPSASDSQTARRFPIDVVFLSPPWGGPSYIHSNTATSEDPTAHPEFTLDMTTPLPGDELFALARGITPHVAYFLPRNSNLKQIAGLVPEDEKVEVEEEWMGAKLKALTCYFGGLVKGQEHMWTR